MEQQVEVLTTETFREKEPELFRQVYEGVQDRKPRFCKAVRGKKAVMGTFAIPNKKNPSNQKISFSYYQTAQKIVFIDDTGYVEKVIRELTNYEMTGYMLFDFMEYILKEDLIYLQGYEERLTKFEEALLQRDVKEFEWKLLAVRKDLASLSSYYEQLEDVGEVLRQDAVERESEREASLFGLHCDRAERLFSMVRQLKEYSMQLREMHQTQIDIRQNEIMKVLTIVTTIFMPLTLITGWYGMNFSNMPELDSPWGYGTVILVCVAIVLGEIWYFKKKKWLD